MKILIIEDFIPNFEYLRMTLHSIDPTWTVEGPLRSSRDVADYFENGNDCDLILSDIRLEDGNVFEVFDSIDIHGRIIITTAYSEFAIKAFDYDCVGYLLKPVDRSELKTAIAKTMSRPYDRIRNPMPVNPCDSTKLFRRRFIARQRDETMVIDTDSIAFLRAGNQTVELITFEDKRFSVNSSLDRCADELNPDNFFRASRQYIININSVEKIIDQFYGKTKVVIRNFHDETIVVSRERSKELFKWLDR